MKKIKKTLTFLSSVLFASFANAQSITCNDFFMLGIGPDPFNPGNSIVHVHMNGNSNDFINYPYISFVTACNGDTIATGGMNFFGQMGQTVQSYPVTGDITNACLPINVEFVYGNSNFQTDTCILTLTSLPAPLTCSDLIPLEIQVDQSNTLIKISMLGTGNTYISNPRISIVTDCVGDTIATGFVNYSGQIGQSTQGYPITSPTNTVCYPITVEFIYGNTNFETDTCLLTLNSPTSIMETMQMEKLISIYPIPSSDKISIITGQKMLEENYQIIDSKGSVMIVGKLVSDYTQLDISQLPNGLYFLKMGNRYRNIIKFIKE